MLATGVDPSRNPMQLLDHRILLLASGNQLEQAALQGWLLLILLKFDPLTSLTRVQLLLFLLLQVQCNLLLESDQILIEKRKKLKLKLLRKELLQTSHKQLSRPRCENLLGIGDK